MYLVEPVILFNHVVKTMKKGFTKSYCINQAFVFSSFRSLMLYRYSKKFEQQSGRTSKRTRRTQEKMLKTQTDNSEKRLMQKRVSRV